MINLNIGKGKIPFSEGKTILDLISHLKSNIEEAKKLGVVAILSDTIVAGYNGRLVDLSTVLTEDGSIEFFTADSEQGLDTLRHSASHIMAQAVLRLYPGSKLGIGPTIKDGFYYDILLPVAISDEDLLKIEEEMRKIISENIPFLREEISKEKAEKFFKEIDQPFKIELIREIDSEVVSLYKNGEFTDLCRGPHIPSTKYLKAFKLLSISGAYWRGSEKNAMLTRIYGTAFPNKKELDNHLNMLEEAKKRDHRKLGKEMNLFSFHEEGPGLPFWKPKGLIVKNLLIEFMREKHRKNGYIEIETPTILRDILWKTSGHWDNYRDNMFFLEKEEESYALKPMNCPGGLLFYKEEIHSYKEMPLKVAEFGKVHRYERSGVLQGLFRVRGFTQDDAHIFTTPELLKNSVLEVINLVDEVYKSFGFEYTVELSTRPEKSMGTEEQWKVAIDGLKQALDDSGLEYTINEGEGAFYGPKIDYHLKDAIGRTHQCGTIQLDMNLPERFDLNYVGSDGKEHRVIMLHRAILGSLERFIGILIEHYGGKFPLWLSPTQVTLLTVSEKVDGYATRIESLLKGNNIRTEIDLSGEKLGYKIRKAQLSRVPYMLVIGEKEVESENVSVRHREKGDLGSILWKKFLSQILEEIHNRV